MAALKGARVLVTGGSRGIGLAIAKRFAKDGAKVCVAAKTAEENPKLPGTIYSAAEEIREAGGEGLPVVCDIRHEDSVYDAVGQAVETFGGLDILVNNASAIYNTSLLDTGMKQYDLMHQVNARGTFLTTKAAMPHLLKSDRSPHVLMLSPPLNMDPKWFHLGGTAYTMAKYGMSMCALGFAEELRGKVGVNALWPKTAIATAAIKRLAGEPGMMASRKPEIMADAAHWIVSQPPSFSGNFCIDEDIILHHLGVPRAELSEYDVAPGMPLMPDFYLGSTDEIQKWLKAERFVKGAAKTVQGIFGKGGSKSER